MATEKVIKIVVEKKGADKSVKELNKEVKKTDNSTKELTSTLDKMSGGVVSGFRNLRGGISKAITSFKSLRVAIIGTGIGALLIAIVSLKEAFTSSEEGQNKFAKILGVIGSITGNLSDVLSNLGMKIISVFENPKQSIIDFGNLVKDQIVNRFIGLIEFIPKLGTALKQLWNRDFSGASKTAANAIGKVVLGTDNLTDSIKNASNELKKFGKEVQEDAKKAQKIADQRAKADKIERNLIVERARANREIAELRFKAEQRDKFSAKERIAFLKEASDLEENITNKEIYATQLRLKAKQAENALANSTKADLDEEAQLKAKLIDLETKRLNLSKLLESKIQSTSREKTEDPLIAEELERQEAIQKIRDDFKRKNEDLEDEDNLAKLERQYERDLIELERLQATEEQKYEIKKYYAGLIADEEQKIIDDFNNEQDDIDAENDQKEIDRTLKRIKLEEDVAAAKESIANRTANLLIQLGGKAAKIGKAIAVAQTIRSGIKGTQEAYSTAQGSAITKVFPAYPIVQAGLAASFAALQVKKILSTQDMGGNSSSIGGGQQPTNAPSFNLVQGTPTNQIAQSISSNNANPVQAFVVGSNMTNQQEFDRNTVEESSI